MGRNGRRQFTDLSIFLCEKNEYGIGVYTAFGIIFISEARITANKKRKTGQ